MTCCCCFLSFCDRRVVNFTRQVRFSVAVRNSFFERLRERHRGLERLFEALVDTLVRTGATTRLRALVAEKVTRVGRATHQFAAAGHFEPFCDGFLSFLHKKVFRKTFFAGIVKGKTEEKGNFLRGKVRRLWRLIAFRFAKEIF